MVSSFQCGVPDNLTDFIDAACKNGLDQLTAGETIHPSLYGFDRAFHRFRLILCRCCQQVGFRKGVIRIKQRVGTIQHSLELTADAVIVDGRCEYQHIRVVHFGGNFHGIVLDDAVPKIQAGEAALAEANLLFPQKHSLYLMTSFLRTLGKGCRQRLRIAVLAGTGRYDQNSLTHSKLLFLLKIFVFLLY